MESTKHIGLRVPTSILERVDALVGELGADRTAVILALLRQTLAMPGTVEQQLYDVQQALLDVQQRLAAVEQKLTAVEQKQSHEDKPLEPSIPHEPSEPMTPLAPKTTRKVNSSNQEKALDAERRIRDTIADLKATDNFPSGIKARVNAIMAHAHCGKQTLNKYKALWHPNYAGLTTSESLTQTEPPSTLSKTKDSRYPVNQAFTTGVAYKLLCEERGLKQSFSTFKRRLREGVLQGALPDELETLGLVADFELRKRNHPNMNTIQWLSLRNITN